MSQSPPADYGVADDGRKRVAKACDRCRLKKIKCDGKVPCSRCTAESSICKFGERKKSVERRVPPGYVEYLEDSHKTFVEAIKMLWKEHQLANGQDGRSSSETLPVHVILDDLGLTNLANRSPAISNSEMNYRMDDPEDIRAQFEAGQSAAHSKASSNASESPVVMHVTTKNLLGDESGRKPSGQISPRSSIAAHKSLARGSDESPLGFGQTITSLDTLAAFGGPASMGLGRSMAQALPTPQPSAGMEDSLWNDYSYFGNSNFEDFDMTADAFDLGNAADSLQQRMDYHQDMAMSLSEANSDMRWINSQVNNATSSSTYGMAARA